MTLQELYQVIGGDYNQAIRVLRMEKLLDKHIRKLTTNGVVEALLEAGETMDPTRLFESAHAMKGVCANLGLVGLAEAASRIAEEYRPGKSRTLGDAGVREILDQIAVQYQRTREGIQAYQEG